MITTEVCTVAAEHHARIETMLASHDWRNAPVWLTLTQRKGIMMTCVNTPAGSAAWGGYVEALRDAVTAAIGPAPHPPRPSGEPCHYAGSATQASASTACTQAVAECAPGTVSNDLATVDCPQCLRALAWRAVAPQHSEESNAAAGHAKPPAPSAKGWHPRPDRPMILFAEQTDADTARSIIARAPHDGGRHDLFVDVLPEEGWYVSRSDATGRVHYVGWSVNPTDAPRSTPATST